MYQSLRCLTIAAPLAVATLCIAPSRAHAQPAPAAACVGAGVLVVDAYAADPVAARAALDALASASGTQPLFGAQPVRQMEGGLAKEHFVVAYKFSCAADATAVLRSPGWAAFTSTLQSSPAQRLTVFSPDPGHVEPSPATASCKRPAYFVLKGQVSDPPAYFRYLKALVGSGLLARHQMRREVVMPGREVRLALDGPSFGPGEFFEILRFPCADEANRFWDSPEYRAMVALRAGAIKVDAWLYE